MFGKPTSRVRAKGHQHTSEESNGITLAGIQLILLKHGIATHREGGALVWNLTHQLGERELVIEIHEPCETKTNTRDLWVYAPKLARANSEAASALSAHLEAKCGPIEYSSSRVLDGPGIGAAWSVPLEALTPHERIAQLVGRLGEAVSAVWTALGRAGKDADDSKQISAADYDGVTTYPDGVPAEGPPQQPSEILDRLAQADATWDRGDSGGALRLYLQLLKVAEGSTPIRLAFQSKILSKMVQIVHHVGPPELGMEYATRALAIDRQLYGDAHNDVAADLLDLAQFYVFAGRPKEALEHLEASKRVDASLPLNGPHAQARAFRQVSVTKVLQDAGFAELAAKQCLDAMPDVEVSLEGHPELGHALVIAADCLIDLGEHNFAERWLRDSIELERRTQDPSERSLGIRLSNLALLLQDTGRFEEASRIMQEARKFPGGADRTFEQEVRIQAGWTTERDGKHDIFLSYNSRDEALVEKLHNALESYGLSAFTFREDPKSKLPMLVTEVLLMLRPHLQASRSLLVVASPTSITSSIVRVEVDNALARNIPVFAWYPQGARFTPEAASIFSDDSNASTLSFAAHLSDERVRSYYGFGVIGGSVEDFARAILFRYLLLSPKHPLRDKFKLSDLGRSVRHATRLRPYLVDKDSQPLEARADNSG